MNNIKKYFRWVGKDIDIVKTRRLCFANYRHHRKWNIGSSLSFEKAGYDILLNSHAIEKGMTNSAPRRFGRNKIEVIARNIEYYKKNGWRKDFAYLYGVAVLKKYCDFYEKNNWQDGEEYIMARNCVEGEDSCINAGTEVIKKSSFSVDAGIDYDRFLSSRHSVRSFADKKLSTTDMKKAVRMAIKTPSACNRQMVKAYFIRNDEIKKKVSKFSRGLTGFNLDNTSLIILTYDTSSLRRTELGQGLFNAGLFAMNLVNAMHSLGIGCCMIEYSVSMKEENKEKKILEIPDCERIAIVIGAGYYKDETIVPKSIRKPLEEIYRER